MSKPSEYRQDLIVSIRYKNDLPPPPMPPKLLDIDTGGLQQYLEPSFAASIAKREEPNIEADAEGGMPIDVIGMYGYFEGDESSITAPDVAPQLDPEDEALMLTVEQLKAGGVTDTSNFLRKTQYMTAASAPTAETRSIQPRQRRDSRPKSIPLAREDKENIKRSIRKAFDLAHPKSAKQEQGSLPIPPNERNAWDRPVHPEKRGLKPVGFYPIQPDFDAATQAGLSWNLLRFHKPPLGAIKGNRDNRLDAAMIVNTKDPERFDDWEVKMKAYEQEPDKYENPGEYPSVWSLWLPESQGVTPLIRKIVDSRDPEHEDAGVMARVESEQHSGVIRFDRSRIYTNVVTQNKEANERVRQVVIGLDDDSRTAKFYPIGQVNLLSADRAKVGQVKRAQDNEAVRSMPDQIDVSIREPNAADLAYRYHERTAFDPDFADTWAGIESAAQAMQQEEEEEEDVQKQEYEATAEDVDMTDT